MFGKLESHNPLLTQMPANHSSKLCLMFSFWMFHYFVFVQRGMMCIYIMSTELSILLKSGV